MGGKRDNPVNCRWETPPVVHSAVGARAVRCPAVRQLLPSQGTPVPDVAARYRAAARREPPGRPWVVLDMITTIDGATAVAGRSGGLGSPGDKAVFRALRALADVVLVGAGTARAEDYGPPQLAEELQTARRAAGQPARPELAVVTNRLALDPTARLFADGHRPLLLAPVEAPAAARAALAPHATILDAGSEAVDTSQALAALRARGARVVVCEGGPTLNAALFADDLVDEVCVSFAPLVVGGPADRLAGPLAATRLAFVLEQALEEDGMLFCRYVRDRSVPAPS